MDQSQPEPVRFTCISCNIVFTSPVEQRMHYRSDFHRYNIKRRIAALPPVSVSVFDQKVLGHQAETDVSTSTRDFFCTICNKAYTTQGPFKSHISSKKHLEKQSKAGSIRPPSDASQPLPENPRGQPQEVAAPEIKGEYLNLAGAVSDQAVEQNIDETNAAAPTRLSPTHCLFCPAEVSSLETNLTHMSQVHSFFLPDADYLTNLPGLIEYLGEKVAVGNVCLFCNDRGRGFRTLHAVRKHMVDKSHCKIAYDSLDDRLEISAFYDFTSSYPDAHVVKETENEEVWEDVTSGESDVDEGVEGVEGTRSSEGSNPESEPDSDLPAVEITYGDSHLELVLPSGARIGHRTMRRYYGQNLSGVVEGHRPVDPNSGAALVRRLLADKNSALVPRKGGFGAFGMGMQVVKAKNKGEAKEAGRHVREFRDQRKREDFKTKVGFLANFQKHYRDPLLQVNNFDSPTFFVIC